MFDVIFSAFCFVESTDAARNAVEIAVSRTEELELQLQKCIDEKNDLEVKMEEILQDSGQIVYPFTFVLFNCHLLLFEVELILLEAN